MGASLSTNFSRLPESVVLKNELFTALYYITYHSIIAFQFRDVFLDFSFYLLSHVTNTKH